MKPSRHDVGWYLDDQERLQGVCLGFDFTAEHEFGIAGLLRSFGVAQKPAPGIPGRTATKAPSIILRETLNLEAPGGIEGGRPAKGKGRAAMVPAAVLAVPQYVIPDPSNSPLVRRYHLHLYGKHNLAASWDEGGFALLARGAQDVALLDEFAAAVSAADIVIAPPSGSGFMRGGLSLVIRSRLPQKVIEDVLEMDLREERLRKAFAATGIERELRAAGLNWYALCPKWEGPGEDEIRVWLNPAEQRRYRHGWYSIQDLRLWARGEGPVVAQGAARS